MILSKLREDALNIYKAGLQAVDPHAAILKHCSRQGDLFLVSNKKYNLGGFKNIYVVGAGKAGAAMATAIEEILPDEITEGAINVKYGHLAPLKKIKIHEAGHPVPDEAGVSGTQKIMSILNQAKEDDLVICLISGGGSALLPLPAAGISLKEKQDLTGKLLACGADITEINTVRKHISQIKGGQFARLAAPARLITLILSDVVGDPLNSIASGPSVPDSSTFQQVLNIFKKYNLESDISDTIKQHIQNGLTGKISETPKPGDSIFNKTQNVIIANNFQAVSAAKQKAEALGYNSMILSSAIEGETREVAKIHTAIAKEIAASGNPVKAPACVISGGETTVTLQGNGKGGRNQEFVLAAALNLACLDSVVILSAGTDGTDGPTDAAGAICDGQTITRAEKSNLDAEKHLNENNAYPFFEALNDLVKTGPTNTNVMDLRIILVGVA